MSVLGLCSVEILSDFFCLVLRVYDFGCFIVLIMFGFFSLILFFSSIVLLVVLVGALYSLSVCFVAVAAAASKFQFVY